MQNTISKHRFYYYVSTKASCDPAKTIYLCPPGQAAKSEEAAGQFAMESGWQEIAEEQEAILVIPIAEQGWAKEPVSLLFDLYNETKNSFQTRSGSAIWGRAGSLWCWETVLYLAGYEDGAVFAGNVLAAYPNFAAAVALIGGLPDTYEKGNQPSGHWMVRNVSTDYAVLNREIPVCLWLFDMQQGSAEEAVSYFAKSCKAREKAEQETIDGINTLVYKNAKEQAHQIRLVTGSFAKEELRSRFIFDQLFAHVIRWKNSPDGTLAWMDSKAEFYQNPRFIRHTVTLKDAAYDYFVHLPDGKSASQVRNMPVVFTIHGRGEPAWMFTVKNGWDRLCDETGEFIVVSPDSPGNIWFLLRDGDVFAKIIAQLKEDYQIDTERVYLTGFSNGAVMAREMAYYRPDLFAAVSPSNGPWFDTRSMQLIDASKPPKETAKEITAYRDAFLENGWQMPCAFFYGDNDPASRAEQDENIASFLAANHCGKEPARVYTGENYFTLQNGYQEGDRFKTSVYCSEDDVPRVCITVMKNMPHGAIYEESRFAWAFLKRFCRRNGEKRVEVIP